MSHRRRLSSVTPAPQIQPDTPPATLRADGLVDVALRDQIATQLVNDDQFARDAIFLLVTTARAHCEPQYAHDLTRMAVQAHLPILKGITAVLDSHPELGRPFYALLKGMAKQVSCRRALDIAIGRYRTSVNPANYVAAFPNSYFDTQMAIVPTEFGGFDLHTRAQDRCTAIGYAALPLDQDHPWQCESIRANARSYVTNVICAGSIGKQAGASAQLQLSSNQQREMVLGIHQRIGELPQYCR